jgi:hypothetical protein
VQPSKSQITHMLSKSRIPQVLTAHAGRRQQRAVSKLGEGGGGGGRPRWRCIFAHVGPARRSRIVAVQHGLQTKGVGCGDGMHGNVWVMIWAACWWWMPALVVVRHTHTGLGPFTGSETMQ